MKHLIRPAAAAALLFAALAPAAAKASDPVPYHELSLMYESCLENARRQMPENQIVIGKALCFCRAQRFADAYEYNELVALAKSADDFNAASQAHLDACKPEVEKQLNLKPAQ